MRNDKTRIAIIEQSEMLAAGLSRLIDDSSDFRVTGTYPDIAGYRERSAPETDADIVILNPAFVASNRKGTVRTLFPNIRPVALLYSYVEREILQQFHETIEIYDKPAKILHKLRTVAGHGTAEQSIPDAGELSDREREILIAVAKGMMNKEIADACNISIHTVISHRKNISRKTGIKSVSGFVVYALLNNLIGEYELQ